MNTDIYRQLDLTAEPDNSRKSLLLIACDLSSHGALIRFIVPGMDSHRARAKSNYVKSQGFISRQTVDKHLVVKYFISVLFIEDPVNPP